jgi:hypothetical protein
MEREAPKEVHCYIKGNHLVLAQELAMPEGVDKEEALASFALGVELTLREELPGVYQFVRTDKAFHAVPKKRFG